MKEKSPKLQTSWEVPYKVVTKINGVVYKIQRNSRLRLILVNLDQLPPYYGTAREEQP
jgi:hypothetical protein